MDAAHSTVARVQLRGFVPGIAFDWRPPGPGRGIYVGEAEVRARLRGPPLPRRLKVYLPTLTSCSYFARGNPREIEAVGILVGRLMHDAGGAYLAVAEEHAPDSFPPNVEPF